MGPANVDLLCCATFVKHRTIQQCTVIILGKNSEDTTTGFKDSLGGISHHRGLTLIDRHNSSKAPTAGRSHKRGSWLSTVMNTDQLLHNNVMQSRPTSRRRSRIRKSMRRRHEMKVNATVAIAPAIEYKYVVTI